MVDASLQKPHTGDVGPQDKGKEGHGIFFLTGELVVSSLGESSWRTFYRLWDLLATTYLMLHWFKPKLSSSMLDTSRSETLTTRTRESERVSAW